MCNFDRRSGRLLVQRSSRPQAEAGKWAKKESLARKRGPLRCRLAKCFCGGAGIFRFLISVGDCGDVWREMGGSCWDRAGTEVGRGGGVTRGGPAELGEGAKCQIFARPGYCGFASSGKRRGDFLASDLAKSGKRRAGLPVLPSRQNS